MGRFGSFVSRVCALEVLESRQLLAAVFWDGGAGNNLWHSPNNWSNNVVPTVVDDVTINVAANPTIQFSSVTGERTINSLTCSEAIAFTGGKLSITTTATLTAATSLTGGTLAGGTWQVPAGITVGAASSTLRDISVIGAVRLNAETAVLDVLGATRFSSLSLSVGGASARFEPGYVLSDPLLAEGSLFTARSITMISAGTLTIAPSGSIRLVAGSAGNLNIGTSGGPMSLVNHGNIVSEAGGRTILIQAVSLTNNGVLRSAAGTFRVETQTFLNMGSVTSQAGSMRLASTSWTNHGPLVLNGGSMTFAGAWHNLGSISINSTSATLNLGGTFTTADINLATFQNVGGVVNIAGILNNTDALLALDQITGNWTLAGGVLSGGTVRAFDGRRLFLSAQGGTLDSTVVEGSLSLDAGSATVDFAGTTRFGAIHVNGFGASIGIAPGFVLHDEILVNNHSSLRPTATGVMTIGATGTIRITGVDSDLHFETTGPSASWLNNGLIQAGPGTLLSLQVAEFVNAGSLLADGATVEFGFSTPWTNTGQIAIDNGLLNTYGNWSNLGVMSASNTVVNLGGFFATASLHPTRTDLLGCTISITGSLDNSADVLVLTPANSWSLRGGTIQGGELDFENGATLVPTTSGGFFRDVHLLDELTLSTSYSYVVLAGDTRFASARMTAHETSIRFAEAFTLHDTIYADLQVGGYCFVTQHGDGTSTIGPSGTVELTATSLGWLSVSNRYGFMSLTNEGVIRTRNPDHNLIVSTESLTNHGSLIAESGELTVRPGAWTNTNGSVLLQPGTSLIIAGDFFAESGIGAFLNNGASVTIEGTIHNQGNVLTLNSFTGSWRFDDGEIVGGTVNITEGQTLSVSDSSGTLRDTSIFGDLALTTPGTLFSVFGSTRFERLRLAASSTRLVVPNMFVLQDTVIAEGSDGDARYCGVSINTSNGSFVLGETGRIEIAPGANVDLYPSSYATSFTNRGAIVCNSTQGYFRIASALFINEGSLEAIDGAMAIESATWSTSGEIVATNTASVTFAGSWQNTGQIKMTDSSLNLGGSFTTAGLGLAGFLCTGTSVVSLAGNLNNTNSVVRLHADAGNWRIGPQGSVTGGVIDCVQGSRLATSNGGTFVDVVYQGVITIDSPGGSISIRGATRFHELRLSSSGATVFFQSGYSLHDPVVADGLATGSRIVRMSSAGQLRVLNSGSIALADGSGGNLVIAQGAAMNLINEGTISIDGTGRMLSFISVSNFTNSGVVRASKGTVHLNSLPISNYSATTFTLAGGSWEVRNGGMISWSNAEIRRVETGTSILLHGSGSAFDSLFYLSENRGSLALGEGRIETFSPVGGTFTNVGSLLIDAGSRLNVTGVFAQSATGVLELAISDPTSYGRVVATGAATLDGLLTITYANYTMTRGHSFDLLSASSVAGTFGSTSIGGVQEYDRPFLRYEPGRVRLEIVAAADWDGDGFVTGLDYDLFVGLFEQGENADFDGDGFLTGLDFDLFVYAFEHG